MAPGSLPDTIKHEAMKRTILIVILLTGICIGKMQAQNDPVLAGMILLYTDKAQKELKNQEKIMMLQTTGHIWTKEEVQATADLQREFNKYLDSFRSIVCYAAQIYGFYHEISRLTANMEDFTRQVSRNTTNALAVALSSERNRIYRELMLGSVEIVNDIRMACLAENKMTEREADRKKCKTLKRTRYGSMEYNIEVWWQGSQRYRQSCFGNRKKRG